MTTLTIAAALLLQTGAANVSPPPRDTVPATRRDTIRLGAPPAPRADTVPVRRDTPRVGRDTLRFGVDSGRAAPRLPLPAPAGPSGPVADSIFDSPATRALVERVIRAGTAVPAELRDYQARMDARITLSVRADSSEGGESPVTIDELAGRVAWSREGVEQRIRGHRVRLLSPTPYTVATVLEAPWVIPHLYGNTIDVFSFAATPGGRARVASAIHPFSWRGLDVYRYEAGDTVRVRTSQGTVTLVPIVVRPRAGAEATTQRTVAGTFHVDLDRAAVARARFGFTDREGRFVVTETGTFFDLENGLVENRWWLPVRQRRELQIGSPLLGGNVAIRMETVLSGLDPNTGWTAEERGGKLVWDLARGDSVFQGYARALGRGDQADIADFGDLREAVRPPDPDAGPVRFGIRYERGEHLFRYNRVEGPYLGLALRAEPRDPERRSWSVYGTAGYAFSESAVRGEASARWQPRPPSPLSPQYVVAATGYRRLVNTQAFRPAFGWELGYALGAALGGYDVRDYYDAAGGELQLSRRRGPFTARLTGRYESQDSVSRNTGRFLFGEARDFPEVADAEPGTHAAVEGELRWQRGPGAFAVGSSLVAAVRGEAGFGDFEVRRVTALLSTRQTGKYVTFLARGDAGIVAGAAPPQFLFRFGGTEGLRGYDRNEFAGSTALLGRARLLLHLPPYGNEPLFRAGFFAFPPLRAAIVASGDAGWSDVSDESLPALDRLFARTTDGWRTSYGLGLSLFEDAVAFEHVWPGDGGEGKWYLGFTSWF